MAALTQIQRVLAITGNKVGEYVGVILGGAANAYNLVALNAQGQLDPTMMPTGVGADTQLLTASEAISAGSLVNVYNNGGTPNVRNANGATGLEADGFVLSAVASGGTATVYLSGLNTAAAGQQLTPGLAYLSDANVGQVSMSPATTAGHIYQQVGVMVSPSVLQFDPLAAYTRS